MEWTILIKVYSLDSHNVIRIVILTQETLMIVAGQDPYAIAVKMIRN